ncbi:MAG: ATP-binding protein [Succinivibrionaceae bacterium]|nr:ATP-binding protein [Succinivibrionaceae bacterium]
MKIKPISRDIYLNRLIAGLDNDLVKVITGIRRCGKSYLLFKLFYEYLLGKRVLDSNIIRINLDDDEFSDLTDFKTLGQFIRDKIVDDSQYYYVFIDEVQLCPNFEKVLNGLIRRENVQVYVTGSNSKFLSSDLITEFRGRSDEIRVYPLCFREFLSAFGENKHAAWQSYLYYGGLPQVLSFDLDERKGEYLKNLIDLVYIRDIVERHKLKNKDMLSTLLLVLASSIGSLSNPHKLANTFNSNGIEVTDDTIAKDIDYLIDSFILAKATRFNVKGRKYVGSPFKYYFVDMGLRNAYLNFRQIEETHLMENIIYNELLVRGFNVDVGLVEVSLKNSSGNYVRRNLEVDFVCNLGSKRYYIQSAFSIPNLEKMEQEEQSLINIDDSFKKIIVVKDDIKLWRNEKGILIIGLMEFLLNPNSLDL